jgi:hypothetical protein
VTSDAEEFGPVVDALVGKSFERTLAANSLKLRFGTHAGPKGTHYIWIDPPWEFHGPDGLIADSDEYTDENFREWSQLFSPLDENFFVGWEALECGDVVFEFASGHFVVIPMIGDVRLAESWYAHWYAKRRQTDGR